MRFLSQIDCYTNDHVNDILKSDSSDLDGWKNEGMNRGKWSNSASVEQKCGNGEVWYGWKNGNNVGSIRGVTF